MQFQVLVSFFFAYIAAVQASPIELPELSTGTVGAPVDLPVDLPVDTQGLPIAGVVPAVSGTVADVASDMNLPVPVDALPVPRSIADTLAGVGETTKNVKDTVDGTVLTIHNLIPVMGKRQESGTLSGMVAHVVKPLDPAVDHAVYAVNNVVASLSGAKRQVGDDLPSIPSTEGVIPDFKAPEVPSLPLGAAKNTILPLPVSDPLQRRQVDIPKVDVPKVDDITQVNTPKIIRRYVRRQNSGCAEGPARRSVGDIAAPDVPALKDVEVPSTPSLPIN